MLGLLAESDAGLAAGGVLVFGVVTAFKLVLLPLYVFGALGMVALARELGLGRAAGFVPALVFFGSSLYPLFLAGGLPNWLFGMSLLPWMRPARFQSVWPWRSRARRIMRGPLAGG